MKTQLVGVVDYGAGNIFSVLRALKATGFQPIILKNDKKIKKCGHIILPGVAAFGVGIKNLHKIGLIDPLKERLKPQQLKNLLKNRNLPTHYQQSKLLWDYHFSIYQQ